MECGGSTPLLLARSLLRAEPFPLCGLAKCPHGESTAAFCVRRLAHATMDVCIEDTGAA
jgi:hypothetical protein